MFRYIRILFLLGVMASLASGDEKIVSFSLSSTGSLSSGTPADLAFFGSEFSGQSDEDGSLFLGNLGKFTLTRPDRGADVYHPNADTFTLALTFLGPLGVHGQTVFDATLHGIVNRNHGSVFIDFGPTRSFTFANDAASGGFDLTIDDITLSVSPESSAYSHVLTGHITNAFDPPASFPEPQAVVLLGTTILLIGSALRHRLPRRR